MHCQTKQVIFRSFYSLLRPFQYPIWIGISVALVFVPICLYMLARQEYAIMQCSFYWTDLNRSFWYTFGTFLGEGITATIDSEPAWGMRQVLQDTGQSDNFHAFLFLNFSRMSVVIWLWYSFIITASYGGELRAVLLKPVSEAPLELLTDILDSPYSWSFVDYGDSLWHFLAARNEVKGMPEFIEGANLVEYKDFPLEYVSKLCNQMK